LERQSIIAPVMLCLYRNSANILSGGFSMHLDGKLIKAVLDASERLKLDICLLDEMGDILASVDEDSVNTVDNWLEQAVFEDGRAEVREAERCYFQLQNENYKPLYVVIPGTMQEVGQYGYLLSSLFSEILKTSIRKPGREEVFKALLMDKADPLEVQEAIRDFKLDPNAKRCVIIVQTFEGDASLLYDTLMKVFTRSKGDVVVALNRYVVALVRQMEDEDDMDDITQLVQALDDTLANEVNNKACLGVGGIKRGLIGIRDSFTEAQEAINLGLMQQNSGRVFMFHQLLLERFLQQVPRDIRRRFYELAYTESIKKVMTDEIIETITKFFENNLNLSEASRKLYIHRNTLIYRLDKIQKATGLDLRTFDDAVLLKIILMLSKSLSSTNRIE
jgi:carbohydrate diacid regulator